MEGLPLRRLVHRAHRRDRGCREPHRDRNRGLRLPGPPQPYPVPQYYPELPGSVAQVAVGLVVWGYHWMLLKKEH
ncbi:hypothetical protein [Methanoculleus chikugoensis]|uniref:hypothetical protein n=1 Tax=Methanoculleus chikugoensis TaxID=118126 RepID=UPI001FB2CC61|nr:hypothetical protein [Methanoculleus chikugoensis]